MNIPWARRSVHGERLIRPPRGCRRSSDLLGSSIVLALLLGSLGCGEETLGPPVPVSVAATSSLTGFAREAAGEFAAVENAIVEVRGGGTHELGTELLSSPAADVVLLAGVDWMDRLEREGRIVPGSRWEAVGNRMAVVGREEARYESVRIVEAATLGFRRLVVPDPAKEPAGRWAREWLEKVGVRGPSIWEQLEDRREIVADVGEVLGALAEDPSAVGVVFLSDLGVVPGTEVLFRSPDLGIRYSFALVDRPERPPEAARFLEFLKSGQGIDLLQRKGFLVEESTIAGP